MFLQDDSACSIVSAQLSYNVSDFHIDLKIRRLGDFRIIVEQVALGGRFRKTSNPIMQLRSFEVLPFVRTAREVDFARMAQSFSSFNLMKMI